MVEPGFEFKSHTADVKVKCWGNNLEEAFTQAAYGLMATITPDLNLIKKKKLKNFQVTAEDKEALLFDFLSEFLYIFDVERLIFGEIKVEDIIRQKDEYTLSVSLKGEEFNRDTHEIGTEVKAITYSDMYIKEVDDMVEIMVVFDI